MYGWTGDQLPTEPLKPWDGIARACIRLTHSSTYCGRTDVDIGREFLFTDPVRASTAYKNDPKFRACEKCVAQCEADGVSETQFLPPMATRTDANNR